MKALRQLRQLFDDLVGVPPTERLAQISQLDLPADISVRLQAMLAFNDVVETVPEQRENRLESMMLASDVATRVREMLMADSKTPLLKSAAADSLKRVADLDGLARALVGTTVGTFRLIALLGQGGSSSVFHAEREAGNGKQFVALKLLRTGLYSEDAHRRFRREQSILAQLSHPNIATLIEAGISTAGIPYLAMELVEGSSITTSANNRCLTIEQRLAQFATLCRTVEAAHSMLIVHRDLKPSNILVTRSGDLKVLDFGIAGLVQTDGVVTRTQSVGLTPEYAAPEQHTSSAVRTALDVYSLGVVLGELLTGCRLDSGKRASAAVISRTAVSRLPNGTPPAHILSRRLKGDLDCVLGCALADEPTARYASAGAFADDIERYLAGKPVRAHPPTNLYRARKFVSRHSLTVAITGALLCAVFAALGLALWQAMVAKNQAVLAAEQARRAETVRDLLISVFDEASADVPKDKRPTIQKIVEKETEHLLQQNTFSEAVRADLLPTMAKVADGVGSYDEALALLDKSIPTIERTYGSNSKELYSATVLRARALIHKSNYSEAAALLSPLQNEFTLQATPTTIDGLILLSKSMVHNRQGDAGVALAHEIVTLAQSKASSDSDLVLEAMINEASNLIDLQRFEDGFRSADAALSFWNENGNVPSRQVITLYENMAVGAEANGDIARAEDSYKQAIVLGNIFFDQPSPVIAWDTGLYGTFLVAQGRLDDAEPYLRDAMSMRRKTYGESDPHTLYAVAGMGKLAFAKGEYDKAAEWYSEGIEVCRTNSVQSVICPRLFALRGRTYAQAGLFDNANRDLQEALNRQRTLSGEDSLSYAYILENLVVVQLGQQQFKDALASADLILSLRKKFNGGMVQTALSTRFYRAKALLSLNRVDEALSELQDIEVQYAHLFPRGDLEFDILAAQAIAFARLNRLESAEQAAKRALGLDQKWKKPDPRAVTDLKHIARITN